MIKTIKTIIISIICLVASMDSLQAKHKDSCKTKIKFKDMTVMESSIEGFYTLKLMFNLAKKSDVPAKLTLIIEVKDCNGKIQKIKVPVKFDEKSGYYIASQSIQKEKSCEYTFMSSSISTVNECGDEENWEAEPKHGKSTFNIKKALSEAGAEVEIK